jgi:hypothetical protein
VNEVVDRYREWFGAFAVLILGGSLNTLEAQSDARFPLTQWATGIEGCGIYDAEIVDLDRDGALDVVVATDLCGGLLNPQSAFWLRGDGTGKQASSEPLPLPPWSLCSSIVSGDFNGDGWPDLALQGASVVGAFGVLTADGLGGFLPAQGHGSVGGWLSEWVVGDLDRDGFDDLVAYDPPTGSLAIFRGSPLGLTPPSFIAIDVNPVQNSQLGDVDGDGILDLVVDTGPWSNGGQVETFFGDGAGSFAPAPVLGNRHFVLCADFDGDGRDELLTLDFDAYELQRWTGAQFHAQPIALPAGVTPVSSHDFDRDGVHELLCEFNGEVQIWSLEGGVAIGPRNSVPMPGGHGFLLVADLDSDGFDELVRYEQEGSMLVASGSGYLRFDGRVMCDDVRGELITAAGDLDGDGLGDVVAFEGGDARSLLGDGTGALHAHWRGTTSESIEWCQLIDLDSDGDLDLYGKYPPNGAPSRRFFMRLNDGSGRFGAVATHSIATHAMDGVSTLLGDFDGDRNVDLLVNRLAQFWLRRGDGEGAFAAPIVTQTNASHAREMLAADFNGDGHDDVVLLNERGEFECFRGSAAGTFSVTLAPLAPTQPWKIATGDYNGDGHADLAYVHWSWVAPLSVSTPTITCHLGTGKFTFASGVSTPLPIGDFPFWLQTVRFDSDTADDLAVVCMADVPQAVDIDRVHVALSAGQGAFRVTQAFYAPSPMLTDIDGDLRCDAFAQFQSSNIGNRIGALIGR